MKLAVLIWILGGRRASFIDPSHRKFSHCNLKICGPPLSILFSDSFHGANPGLTDHNDWLNLEGGSNLSVPAGHVFNPAVIVNWDPCVHGLGMFENRQFKGKFLKKFVTNKNTEKAGGYHMYDWYVVDWNYVRNGAVPCLTFFSNTLNLLLWICGSVHSHLPYFPLTDVGALNEITPEFDMHSDDEAEEFIGFTINEYSEFIEVHWNYVRNGVVPC